MSIQAENALAAKVLARNLAEQKVGERLPAVLQALRPFVGQKVINVDGSIAKKVKAALPATIGLTGQVQVWYSARFTGLSLHVKVACNYPNRQGEYCTCVYQEQWAHLGNIDGQILQPLYAGPYGLRTDWTVQEVVKARADLSAAQKAVRAAESALCHFGEHDNH